MVKAFVLIWLGTVCIASNTFGQNVISINFVGGGSPGGTPSPLVPTDTAGVIVASNWNNVAQGVASGAVSNLLENSGNNMGVSVEWTADSTAATTIGETTGDLKMMKGYLDNPVHDTTIKVDNVPYASYDVYVYFNGDNGGGSPIGSYTLTVGPVYSNTVGKVAGVFNGTFIQATGTNAADPNALGNYIVFHVPGFTSFTLQAHTESLRAPINGLQIVHNGISPSNDLCSGAIPMAEGVVYSADTATATYVGDPIPPCDEDPVPFPPYGVWYTITPSTNGMAMIKTCDSDFDTILSVYTGTCGSLTAVACNDDHGPGCDAKSIKASVMFNVQAGVTYRVLAGGSEGDIGNLNISWLMVPPNDQCSNAIVMTPGVTYMAYTESASSINDPLPSCNDINVRGIWYQLTPTNSAAMTISTCGSDFDTDLSIYTGTCGSLTEIPGGCDDDYGPSCSSIQASLVLNAVAGTTYWILAGGYAEEYGNLRITASYVPTNDLCSGAITMQPGVTYAQNTTTATSLDDPLPDCVTNTINGVWYQFTPSLNGPVTISTCGSDFDTVLSVYTGACGSLTEIPGGCNDDNGPACPGSQASLSFNGVAGTTYRVLVGGNNADSGNLRILAVQNNGVAEAVVTKVAAGGAHSLFLKSDGSLWAMGTNSNGQLGDGTTNAINIPKQIISSNVIAIAAGGAHSIFLRSDGSLWVMGNNSNGQLGDGTTNDVFIPKGIIAGGVTGVAAGNTHTLLLKSDGSLWAMGANNSGELGDGTYNQTNRPELIISSNVTAISAGNAFSLFLKSDGSLWAMGDNTFGQLGNGVHNTTNRPVQILASNVTAIAGGNDHILFLKSGGSLWAMGNNLAGQLGDGTFNSTNSPEQILATNVFAVTAGNAFSLFVKADGSLWAMGANYNGQLGDGTFNNINHPELIVASNVTTAAASSFHFGTYGFGFSLFLKNDGSLWAMGEGDSGQLGDDIYNNIKEPLRIIPYIDFTATPLNGEEPLNVQFGAPGIDPNNRTIISWAWDFGDGANGASQNPTHTYTINGLFHPALRMTNSTGTTLIGYGPSITVNPFNDNFESRVAIQGMAFGNNSSATIQPNEPNPGNILDPSGQQKVSVANTTWWTWTAPTNGIASVLTSGSGFSTIVDVYTGNTLASLVCVASNAQSVADELRQIPGTGSANRLGFQVTAGTTYQIQVSGVSDGQIQIAVQPIAIDVLSVQTTSNTDGSLNFTASGRVGNSSLVTPGPLRVQVLAIPGCVYALTTPPFSFPPVQVLTNYFLGNPTTVTPGTNKNFSIFGVCPAPTQDAANIGFYWGVYAVLQEQLGTNWFFRDDDFVCLGKIPDVNGTILGPTGVIKIIRPLLQSGVIRININPTSGGTSARFQSAAINGPVMVNQNSTTNYYGIASFSDGKMSYPVNFTDTVWTASQFDITTNGVFRAGPANTNTRVTLSAYYAYDFYGYTFTNISPFSVLIVPYPNPSLSSSKVFSNQLFQMTLNAVPGDRIAIEVSTNLSNPRWAPLITNTTDTNGIWNFTDTKTTNQNQRFYRAMKIP